MKPAILSYSTLCSRMVTVRRTLAQTLRLCTGSTSHRGSRGIALLFLDHGTRSWWGISSTSRPPFTPGKDAVPFVQEAGWARRPVWTGAENHAPNGIRSPDLPARSQLLYRLSYPAHVSLQYSIHKTQGLQKTSIPIFMGRLNNQCRNVCIWSFTWRVQRVASEPPRAPGCHAVCWAVKTDATPVQI